MKARYVENVLLTMLILSWGPAQGVEYSPVPEKQSIGQEKCWNNQEALSDDLYTRIWEMAQEAETEDELKAALGNDPLTQELGSALGGGLTVRTLQTGYCYLTPLICLWRSHAADPNCTYNCIGLYGLGEIRTDETADCDPVVGCILFPNCLAICVTIIPSGPPPVIR